MKRNVDLLDISDGRLYAGRDFARIGCHGCAGCSTCCHGMGNSAILDPMDIYRLHRGAGLSFEVLLSGFVELNVVDGIVLPNLRMSKQEEACGFLNEEGRCRVHSHRPGVCRLFPLGRYYRQDGSFAYFIQKDECPAANKTRVRIERWLDIPNLAAYEAYIRAWHGLLEAAESYAAGAATQEELQNVSLFLLKMFYLKPYDLNADFYSQFDLRHRLAAEALA